MAFDSVTQVVSDTLVPLDSDTLVALVLGTLVALDSDTQVVQVLVRDAVEKDILS